MANHVKVIFPSGTCDDCLEWTPTLMAYPTGAKLCGRCYKTRNECEDGTAILAVRAPWLRTVECALETFVSDYEGADGWAGRVASAKDVLVQVRAGLASLEDQKS